MLELEEILQRLRKHDEKFEKILERLDRHESELVKLREDMNKLREDMILGFKRHDEILERYAQEIAKLREDFNKMLNIIIQIQEDQMRLHESYERLEKHINILEKSLKSLEGAMLRGFADMSKFVDITFEEFVRNFLTEALRRFSEITEGVELKKAIIDGEEKHLLRKSINNR